MSRQEISSLKRACYIYVVVRIVQLQNGLPTTTIYTVYKAASHFQTLTKKTDIAKFGGGLVSIQEVAERSRVHTAQRIEHAMYSSHTPLKTNASGIKAQCLHDNTQHCCILCTTPTASLAITEQQFDSGVQATVKEQQQQHDQP